MRAVKTAKGIGYQVKGKGVCTTVHTAPSKSRFWLLPGQFVSKVEAKGFKKYRRKAWQLRQSAKRQNLIVDVGDAYLVTETLVFDTISDACSFVLANSRSGDVAKRGRATLTGRRLRAVSSK